MDQQENFMPKRKPASEHVPDISSLPGPVQRALMKNVKEETQEEKFAHTGNSQLDFLLSGIKDTVYRYEEILLPSKGKFYDGIVGPTDGILHVRMMVGEDEQTLATQRMIKSGQALNTIYKSCVRESIVPSKMLAVDRTFLLIYLRGISHGEIYTTDIKCSECGKNFESQIDLDDLDKTMCPDDFNVDSLEGTLPKSGYNFTYRLATGEDEQLIQDYREKKNRKNDSTDDTWAYRSSLLINQIEGLQDKAAIQILMTRLPVADVSYIRTALNDTPFGVDTELSISCPYCSNEFKAVLPMDVNFFFPSQKKEKDTPAMS